MDWYYKAGLIVGLIWAAARALGAYGESAREFDIAFLFGFLLTTGGWAAVFLVIDRVAKFLGLRPNRSPPAKTDNRSNPPPLPTPVPLRPPARAKRRRGR